MARNPRKKALYEVIREGYPTSGGDVTRQGSSEQDIKRAVSPPVRQAGLRGWTGTGGGKDLLVISYPVVAIIVIAIFLALLISFWLGRKTAKSVVEYIEQQPQQEAIPESFAAFPDRGFGEPEPTKAQAPETGLMQEVSQPAETGDHVVVIATYKIRRDLEPVKQYFAENGIETEIIQKSNYYLLVTKNKYENPQRQGTNGYEARQRIKRIGAVYRAPDGYESFRPNLFQDAYGMKTEN